MQSDVFSPSLEHNHCVRLQVRHVQLLTLLDDVGMFANQQPADVGEEESPLGVVRVRVRLRVLVVGAVVSRPLVDVILLRRDMERCAGVCGQRTWHGDARMEPSGRNVRLLPQRPLNC